MNKWRGILLYSVCFFLLSGSIYRLAVFVPPLPGESGYLIYAGISAVCAVLIGGLCVAGIAFLDYQVHRKENDS